MIKLKITELKRKTLSEYKNAEKTSLIIILDNIRSLNNIGSIFRTSDAFLVEAIYLCGITAIPPNQEIHKTALGAEHSVDWEYFEDTLDAIKGLKQQNYKIYAIEQAKESVQLHELKLSPLTKYAIVMGNEVKGVQQKVIDSCDGCIEIPQFGTKHSLNVSVTAGIVIWDFFKQLNKKDL